MPGKEECMIGLFIFIPGMALISEIKIYVIGIDTSDDDASHDCLCLAEREHMILLNFVLGMYSAALRGIH